MGRGGAREGSDRYRFPRRLVEADTRGGPNVGFPGHVLFDVPGAALALGGFEVDFGMDIRAQYYLLLGIMLVAVVIHRDWKLALVGLTALCAAHHLHGVHGGWIRVRGEAPGGLFWTMAAPRGGKPD